jgi:hypothetical protein
MAFSKRNLAQIVWGVLLIAMGVLLCVKEPYALRLSPDSTFLKFARYFIGVFLIAGGVKKLYRFCFFRESSQADRRNKEL